MCLLKMASEGVLHVIIQVLFFDLDGYVLSKGNFHVCDIHGRCLRLIYNHKKPPFEVLNKEDGSVPTHSKSLRSLAIEINKVRRDISPEILNDLFTLRHADQCNLIDRSYVKTVNYGFESLQYLGLKIPEAIPSHLNEIDDLKNFKNAI